jgi:hypothetical protein
MTDEQFNAVRIGMAWSPAQILEHMMIANRAYLPVIEEKVREGKRGDTPIAHSWFGRLLVKASGPGGNAPAPRILRPPAKVYPRELLRHWIEQHEAIADLAAAATGTDLANTKLRNPFLRYFRMNLYDAFEVIVQHGERHVRQIELV